MEQADLIWMNGEFVAWEDAKVHVLTHGLHYGTGVFEGIRCYETDVGPAVFRHHDHLDRLVRSAELYYMPTAVHARASCARRRSSSSAATACAPATSARSSSAATATMGLNPLDAPVDVAIAAWEWGAYLGEEGKRDGIRAKVSSWRRISARLADPARQGLRASTSTRPGQDRVAQGRLRRGDPARRPRLRLRGLGREHLRRPRRRDRHAARRQLDPRRHQPQLDASRSRATSATRSSSATSRAPSSTWPTRCS